MSIKTGKFEFTMPANNCASIILVGASRSGKTTLLKHIYKTHFKDHITTMFSMNKHADIYKDLSDKVMVTDKFHPEMIKEAHDINTLCDNKYEFLFISDDYVDGAIKNHPEVTRAMSVYRNAGISSIWSFQGRTMMSSVGRNNANYICVLKQQTPLEWEAVIKEFLSMWLPTGMTMREMIAFCKDACENHQFFFINQIEGTCILTKLSKSQI